MDPIQRVLIYDKHPVLEPEVFNRPINRGVLAVALVSLLMQIAAMVQVALGMGSSFGLFNHVSFVVVALLWLALGVMVFLQRRAQLAGQLFLLSAAAGSTFLSLSTLFRVNLVDALLYAAGLLLFPPFLFSYARHASQIRPWRRREFLLYVPPILLIWPGAQDLLHEYTSPLWRLAMLAIALYLVGAIAQAFLDWLAARSPEEAAQSRALLFGLIAGAAPGIFSFVRPLVVTGGLGPIGLDWLPPMVLGFLVAMSYAVLLFEFSEADLIVRRGVVYGTLTLVIVVAYAILGFALTVSSATVTSPAGGLGFVAVTVLLVGAAFTPIMRMARRLADWLLYGGHTDRWDLLQALSARLATVMQPEELGAVLVRELARALHLHGAFLLRRTSNGRFALWHRVEGPSTAQPEPSPVAELDAATVHSALGDPPGAVLLIHKKPLTASRRSTVPERYRVLDDLRSALTIPLVTRSGLEAVLCLQPKLAHDAFDADDLELLAPVMRQATAALDNALLFSRLEEKVQELRQAYVRIAREQEAERARLAHELHDGTAQELAGLITLATVVERQLDGSNGGARGTLQRLRRQAEDAYQGVRRASHALRPLMLDDFGLGPTLARYLDQFQESTGIAVDYQMDDVGPLPDDVELALFRVAQECMENVRKHSGSERTILHLHRRNGSVVLSVADEGRGISQSAERGIGLAGMRERIESVGGSLHLDSAPGQGLRVEAAVPLEATA